jgi:hypothetical protein
MLLDLVQPLVVGESFDLTLTFAEAGRSHRRGQGRTVIRQAARRAAIGIALVAFVVSSCGSPVRRRSSTSTSSPRERLGLIATNRAPEIFPADLTVRVGDSITIVNEDDFDQEVGPTS